MKAIELIKPGGLDQLQVAERPDPGQPGPGEIRVRVHASSLNFHDYLVVSGKIPNDDKRIPMADGAGVVEAIGDGIEEFKTGDAVVSCFFPWWQEGGPVEGFSKGVHVDGMTAMHGSWWSHLLTGLPGRRQVTAMPRQRH